MLYITVKSEDLFDERKGEFISVKPTKLQLEHSLVSVSKWEAKHHKSFLKNVQDLTPEELLSYIECMNMTQNVNPDVFRALSAENLQEIMLIAFVAMVLIGNIGAWYDILRKK